MRYIRYLILIALALAAIVISLANRGPVTLHALPDELVGVAPTFPNAITIPIYVALFAAMFVGVIVGLVLEAIRETGHRRAERDYRRQAVRLNKEVKRLSQKAGEEEDDILGLERS